MRLPSYLVMLQETKFTVTQGHRNRHGSISYQLSISWSAVGPILYRFRKTYKRRIPPKIAKFSNPLYLTPLLMVFR